VIRITCTHCRQVLTIDDGFAGGVCRCQHCGTIQTVPGASGKHQGRGASPAARTLYRAAPHRSADESHHGSGSGLDELAEIVSSSGLSHSRRLSQHVGGNGIPSSAGMPGTPAAKRARPTPLLAVTGGLILLLLVVIAFLLLRASNQSNIPAPPPVTANPPAPPPAPAGPNFGGMPLQAQDTVVYLIDNGGSAGDVLPAVQAACYQSIKSLTSDRRFKVIFWRPGSASYPADPTGGTARATDDEEKKCEAALADTYAEGNTNVDDGLKLAMSVQPDAIVLVTAKAAQLPDDFADTVLAIRGDSRVKIYAVGINGDSTTDSTKMGLLATLAAHSGGQFLNLSSSDLDRLMR
jgi:hypothetical protein